MSDSYKVENSENRRVIYQDSRIGKVDVADSANVEKWAKVLGISENELLDSVEDFGSLVVDIRKGRRNQAAQRG